MIQLKRINEKDEFLKIDDLINDSLNGTIFHTKKFLNYHKNKFKGKDEWYIFLRKNKIIGVISFLIKVEGNNCNLGISPFGASYGGIVLFKRITYKVANEMIHALIEKFKYKKIKSFKFTHPISCCLKEKCDILEFAMLKNNFKIVNRDISSVIRLKNFNEINQKITPRVKRNINKAIKNNVKIKHHASLNDFWIPLKETFIKHKTNPTHTYEELKILEEIYKEDLNFCVAYLREKPIASSLVFKVNNLVVNTFYLCQTEEGSKIQALSYLISEIMSFYKKDGYDFLDLGTSSVNMIPRENIFEFKEGFSSEGFFRDSYYWEPN